jgi:hypothetical protein
MKRVGEQSLRIEIADLGSYTRVLLRPPHVDHYYFIIQEISPVDENDRGEAVVIASGISLHVLMIDDQRCNRNDASGLGQEATACILGIITT